MPDSDAEVPDPTKSSGKGKGKGKGKREEPLSLDDCLCPVCLDMFLEPVTLPCMHTFCKACFLESVDKSALCCPMCRKRVSTWVRLNNKNKTLVNQQLWTQIQLSFPQRCQRRLSGQDAVNDDDLTVFSPRTSQPGELRQEYQEQINKLSEEKRELEEEEQHASEEYIHKLLVEEEEILQEERKRSKEDEQLAKMLNKELNTAPVSPDNRHRAHITPAKKKVNTAGHIEKFLCRLPSKSSPSECSSTTTLISNKENIRLSHGERLPQADLYRTQQDQPEPPCPGPASPLEARHCRICHTDAGTSKRKSSEPADEEEAKRARLHLPSSSSSAPPLEGALVLQAELEAQLERRRQQEEADRQMALLLQEKLDQEERQQQTNRRKGTIDAYLLRRVGGDTRRRNSRTSMTSPLSLSTSSSSSSSSSSSEVSTSSSQNDSSRQSTLTDIFSDLSS
ncbi:E3 ubiquitin-protein ligase rnf168 [Syngnathus acus]|uniref:E3 ubiquitin-protein ligase rnf168 n=1 Tax=Syngnathus acus TaxID=161584 RepID=UPI0018860DE8|nr:E3 ubiquitin-protein ligase rnf168 [Syngnathus acus]XP_037123306.1 E3 ubiquitin-protein ligase rnf168 [Syngnathus acus]XP_037123307.1 E3 ubiquitin-protein ligase rnf168 [Syngnathus acus]